MQLVVLLIFIFLGLCSCTEQQEDSGLKSCICHSDGTADNTIYKALLASRFESMEALQKVIDIEYIDVDEHTDSTGDANSCVLLRHCSHNQQATSVLCSGITQKNITDAANGNFIARSQLVLQEPYAGRNRLNLYKVFNLGRRRPNVYGANDVAFYDLALASVEHIIPNATTFIHPQDSGEKGYLNTFNHITAQAFISCCFSESFADYIADVHERNNMQQLITGKFPPAIDKEDQLKPIDNYVDMINNEWGQALGLELKKSLDINAHTVWTPQLLCDFLNKIQLYYSRAFDFSMHPFKKEDELIQKFTLKINKVLIDAVIN